VRADAARGRLLAGAVAAGCARHAAAAAGRVGAAGVCVCVSSVRMQGGAHVCGPGSQVSARSHAPCCAFAERLAVWLLCPAAPICLPAGAGAGAAAHDGLVGSIGRPPGAPVLAWPRAGAGLCVCVCVVGGGLLARAASCCVCSASHGMPVRPVPNSDGLTDAGAPLTHTHTHTHTHTRVRCWASWRCRQ
jgi:hypothetical protein